MNEVKITAKSYDEALTNALIELQTTSDNVKVTVLEEGSDGLFGILGGKPWVLAVKMISEDDRISDESEEVEEIEIPVAPKKAAPVPQKKAEPAVKAEEEREEETKEEEVAEATDDADFVEEDAEALIQKADEFLKNIFKVMKMDVALEYAFNQKEKELAVVMSGDDMGVLIGKRGQTLDSLQYLTSLVVNKHQENYIRVKLDTENYRHKREVKLEELARNIASKVKRTKRSVELVPMNPYERRIIHSALQGDAYVTTISEGEEPYRHVIVMLKNDKKPRKRYH